jgi:hypothetical protein
MIRSKITDQNTLIEYVFSNNQLFQSNINNGQYERLKITKRTNIAGFEALSSLSDER